MPARSTDPQDYMTIPRPVAAMPKTFRAGARTGLHAHDRDQFLYAVEGVMRVATVGEMWIVPADRAVYMPAGVAHETSMRGRVEMRTLYIRPRAHSGLPSAPVGMEVSPLLRALVLALMEEPLLYDQKGRGGRIAGLVLDEIARAERSPLAMGVPMPRDPRLLRLAKTLMEDPARAETLDEWADKCAASPRTLTRLFQAEMGLTFTRWRQRVRFHAALEALARGEPVARVAEANGYASASAFTAAFRKVMGAPPGRMV